MAINSGRLVVDPVTESTRAKIRQVSVQISNIRPPTLYVYNDPAEGLVAVNQEASYKGQIRLFQDLANDRNILLVAIEVTTPGQNGAPDYSEFVWKEVRATWYYSDALTGEEFRAL